MKKITKKNNHITYIDFYFTQNKPSYDDYQKMIQTTRKEYLFEIIKLKLKRDYLISKFSSTEMIKLAHCHKALINKILKRTIKLYKPLLKNKKVGIYWNGSFGRNSNRLSSDYDLNFIYPNKLRKIMLPIEEQICSALAKIVNRPRDLVHGAVPCHLPLLNKLDSKKAFTGMIFRMNWKNKESASQENISTGLENLMYRIYWANKSDQTYTSYLSNSVDSDRCEFWSTTHEPVYGKKITQGIFDKVTEKEINITKNKKFVLEFNKLINNFHKLLISQKKELLEVDTSKVKNIKKYYKKRPLENIFNVLALIRRKLLSKEIDIGSMKIDKYASNKNIKKLLGKQLFHKFFEKTSYYLWSIIRLETIFEKENIRFGSHSKQNVNNLFQKSYSSTCPDVNNFQLHHNSLLDELHKILEEVLNKLKIEYMNYDVRKEYINITNYSPFSHINEVSLKFQKQPFLLPFIKVNSKEVPVHPDTFKDLQLNKKNIIKQILVYPTSSFRTVYFPKKNICYKLPLLRKITRGLRDLSNKELDRSNRAQKLLSSHNFEGFNFLSEKCYKSNNPNFNYIIRKMPKTKCFPWFYVISSQKFDADFEMKCMSKIIKSWMFLASKEIFLESPHTQNFLVDSDTNIYYRDLSDVRVVKTKKDKDSVLLPSYYNKDYNPGDVLSIIFDRAVCRQNLDHLFKYSKKLGNKEKKIIKQLIQTEINKYNLPFPNYSMDFIKNKPERIPQKIKLTSWRK